MFWSICSKLLIAYPIISIFLFIFPNLLHKKKKINHPIFKKALHEGKCLHISHRGGAREGLENTMPAFKNAVDVGTNMLELDVCMTKDGKIVVCHDENLIRLCGVDVNITQLNYNELPRHGAFVPIQFAINQEYDTTKLNPYFPLLEEVFQAFPSTGINIEIKTPSNESIQKTGVLIQRYNREELTIWGCKHSKHNKIIKQNFPSSITFFSANRALLTYILLLTGLLPFFPIHDDSLQIPLVTNDYFTWKMETEGSYKIKTMFGLVKFMNFLGPVLFWHLKKRGILCIYWVVNAEEDFEKCLKQNAHGIMTDKPTFLKDYLIRRDKFIPNHVH